MPDQAKYEELLGRVFDQMRGSLRETLSPSDYALVRDAFVFHMSDWTGDLEALGRLYEGSGSVDTDEATDVLMGFLYHAVAHLNAAARVLLDYAADTFEGDEAFQILARGEKAAAVGGRQRKPQQSHRPDDIHAEGQ